MEERVMMEMTKRFTYLDYKDTVRDNETGKEYHTWYEDNLLDLLNGLADENEQLKSEIKDFQELLAGKEEELLKPIIRLIDEKIEEIKQYNSELCRLTLIELRKEITKK